MTKTEEFLNMIKPTSVATAYVLSTIILILSILFKTTIVGHFMAVISFVILFTAFDVVGWGLAIPEIIVYLRKNIAVHISLATKDMCVVGFKANVSN